MQIVEDTLSAAITNAREDLLGNERESCEFVRIMQTQTELMEGVGDRYEQFRSWADIYDTATVEERKMIACQLILCAEVRKDYRLKVFINPTFGQFFGTEHPKDLPEDTRIA